jgi:hypothetical protein
MAGKKGRKNCAGKGPLAMKRPIVSKSSVDKCNNLYGVTDNVINNNLKC